MDIEQVKTLHLDGTDCFIVLTLPDGSDPATFDFAKRSMEQHFPGRTVVVIPASCELRAYPTNGVYYRERYEEREIEIISENEEALTARLKELFPDNTNP